MFDLNLKKIHSRVLVWLLFCTVVISSTPCFSTQEAEKPEPLDPALALEIDSLLEELVAEHEIPGLAVAITSAQATRYARALGVANLATGKQLTPESLFHFASVSKPFVATAIVQLHERGKIDLDARVIKYLPYFKLADKKFRKITIRQMLNHTSGMPDVDDYEWDKPQYDEGAAERYVRSLSNEKMLFAPGEGWRYSNMAFDTLGDVIHKVSGRPFEVYVAENILQPLGMKNSTFLYSDTPEALRTTGHVFKKGPAVSGVYPYNRRHAPSSTLNSNVLEMTHWARVNLNRGTFNGTKILEPESYELLFTPGAKAGTVAIGLSWFVSEYRGHRMIGHSGGDTGFVSQFSLLPEDGLGVIVVSNYERSPVNKIARRVFDLLLGLEAEQP